MAEARHLQPGGLCAAGPNPQERQVLPAGKPTTFVSDLSAHSTFRPLSMHTTRLPIVKTHSCAKSSSVSTGIGVLIL